jgi:hypothetical protein
MKGNVAGKREHGIELISCEIPLRAQGCRCGLCPKPVKELKILNCRRAGANVAIVDTQGNRI